MPYICNALEFSSRDTFVSIKLNLWWELVLPEGNLSLKGSPRGSRWAGPPCNPPVSPGGWDLGAALPGWRMQSRGCLLSPVTMVTSQPAAALPTIVKMSKGFQCRLGWWAVLEKAWSLGKSWPLAQLSQSPLLGLPAESRVHFRPGFARTAWEMSPRTNMLPSPCLVAMGESEAWKREHSTGSFLFSS